MLCRNEESYFDMQERQQHHKLHIERLAHLKPVVTSAPPIRNGRLIRKEMVCRKQIAEQRKQDAENLNFIKSFHLRQETLRMKNWRNDENYNSTPYSARILSPVSTTSTFRQSITPRQQFSISEPPMPKISPQKSYRRTSKKKGGDDIDKFIIDLEKQIKANELNKIANKSPRNRNNTPK
ncbi:hypothetical protein TVAG_038160 [Trichomonas vaginalis G3]|uniref:Uncharacterized protein n=1 Tax=Trichomonas vaginalis (strain ATCC PRA-98 / G3) TaxID=412133 RepID=A2DXX4_TRIV3|nr:hypothetical protein TVAGG3_0961160 [Trichomonas vaginalis G3]EAY14710.1 hypothetical protein TVAG_038160 [Trichomonas vaginalis G3]KAI5487919.1 hypothetical protein TVAGG3_0961160 [Trichomonas vaginalis G3]|eukprot:XP_001326933.1 hypothetical protein [Trichomonas vaginalis G3]